MGSLLAGGPMEPGGFEHDSFQVLESRGSRPLRIGDAGLAGSHPRIDTSGYLDGYFNARGGWAESGAVVARLLELCEAAGVELVAGVFEAVSSSGSRVDGVRTPDGSTYSADQVVVACGAWTPTLLPWLSDVLWATGHPVLHFQAPIGVPVSSTGGRFAPQGSGRRTARAGPDRFDPSRPFLLDLSFPR